MLVKEILAAAIKQALDAQSDVQINPAEARAIIADDLAQAIFDFIKSAQVNPGIALQAGSYSGVTTGIGTLS